MARVDRHGVDAQRWCALRAGGIQFVVPESAGRGIISIETAVGVPEPEPIERPPQESVVGSLKRLSKTYPMLDKSEMLSATSDLVASQIMQGGDPAGTIDRLEKIFLEHYEQLRAASRD